MTTTIAVANAKGGCGKTTTALHLSAELASRGLRVLMVDIDPQHTLSRHLGVVPSQGTPTVRDILFDELPVSSVRVEVQPNLWLIPSSLELATADVDLASEPAADQRLRPALSEPDWDFCIIDCPPSLGRLSMNALVASDGVLVPIDSAPYAMEGHDMLMRRVREAQKYYNRDLRLLGVLLTLYDNTRASRQVGETVRQRWPQETFRTTIRRSTRVKDAAVFRELLLDSSTDGAGSDYRALAEEILERVGVRYRVAS